MSNRSQPLLKTIRKGVSIYLIIDDEGEINLTYKKSANIKTFSLKPYNMGSLICKDKSIKIMFKNEFLQNIMGLDIDIISSFINFREKDIINYQRIIDNTDSDDDDNYNSAFRELLQNKFIKIQLAKKPFIKKNVILYIIFNLIESYIQKYTTIRTTFLREHDTLLDQIGINFICYIVSNSIEKFFITYKNSENVSNKQLFELFIKLYNLIIYFFETNLFYINFFIIQYIIY